MFHHEGFKRIFTIRALNCCAGSNPAGDSSFQPFSLQSADSPTNLINKRGPAECVDTVMAGLDAPANGAVPWSDLGSD